MTAKRKRPNIRAASETSHRMPVPKLSLPNSDSCPSPMPCAASGLRYELVGLCSICCRLLLAQQPGGSNPIHAEDLTPYCGLRKREP